MSGDKELELTQSIDKPMKTEEEKVANAFIDTFSETNVNLEGLSKRKKTKKLAESKRAMNIVIKSLESNEVLKSMLATQMFTIYEAQRKASKNSDPSNLIKLSNVFIQQVGLMQKLTGHGQQKVTVEHVHVHSGGQAIVGNIDTKIKGGGEGGR